MALFSACNRAAVVLAILLALPARADSPDTWGEYEIHYTTFPSTFIPADVAAAHNLKRADNRIVTNITVRRDGEPVRATVTGTSRNLLNQLFQLSFVEVAEQDAVYYLTNQIVDERDTLIFDLMIQPLGEPEVYNLTFRREYRY